MKKGMLILFLLSFHCFGQEDKSFFVNATEAIVKNDGYYNVNELMIGKAWDFNGESALDLGLAYRFSISFRKKFKSHFLGGSITYSFWPKERRVRPFINLALFTEVATNYKNGLLLGYGHVPIDKYSYNGEENYARWYKGTPIVGNLFFGFNIRLFPDLYLKPALGISYESVRSKSLTWIDGEIENPLEEANKKTMKISSVYSYNLQIGLRYMFSFKKSSKSK